MMCSSLEVRGSCLAVPLIVGGGALTSSTNLLFSWLPVRHCLSSHLNVFFSQMKKKVQEEERKRKQRERVRENRKWAESQDLTPYLKRLQAEKEGVSVHGSEDDRNSEEVSTESVIEGGIKWEVAIQQQHITCADGFFKCNWLYASETTRASCNTETFLNPFFIFILEIGM